MIEEKLDLLIAAINADTAAINANTAALNEILSAGAATPNPAPQAPKAPAKGKAKAAPAPATEPAPETAKEPEAEEPVTETPTKVPVSAPPETEFSDPLDPDTKVVVQGDPPAAKIDPNAVITQITDSWKAIMVASDAERKGFLKTEFPKLRAKWGLGPDDKLISLAGQPEKLVGLLGDIKSL